MSLLNQRIDQSKSTVVFNLTLAPTVPSQENKDYRQPSPCGRTLCVLQPHVAFYCPELPTMRCSDCHQNIADNYGNPPGTY